jgi:hypothetical protein
LKQEVINVKTCENNISNDIQPIIIRSRSQQNYRKSKTLNKKKRNVLDTIRACGEEVKIEPVIVDDQN